MFSVMNASLLSLNWKMRSNPKTLEGKLKPILYADQALRCVLILLKSCDKFLVIPVKVELIYEVYIQADIVNYMYIYFI